MVGVGIVGYLILHAFWPVLVIPVCVVTGFVWHYKNSIINKWKFILVGIATCYLLYILIGIYAISFFRPIDGSMSLFLVAVINLFVSYLFMLFLYLFWSGTKKAN